MLVKHNKILSMPTANKDHVLPLKQIQKVNELPIKHVYNFLICLNCIK